MDAESDFSDYATARWSRLVRSAVLLGCTPSEAEDLVQTVLERCLVKWRRVQRSRDRDSYVHRILVNTFITSRRRRWVGEQPTSELPDVLAPDESSRVDDADVMMRALARLTQDQRTVVVLRYYAHLDEQQMASVLGVAPGTVKSRLARALARLATDAQLSDLRGTR